MRKHWPVLGAMVCLLAFTPFAFTQWFDNFDTYANGTSLHGVGGWEGWENDPSFTAFVTNSMARSGPNSVDISGAADLVQTFTGYNTGMWTMSAYQYIPGNFTGETYFIMLNTYGAGVHNWSTQLSFDNATNVVQSDTGGPTLPLIRDQWVEVRIDLDFNADTQTIYYGGTLLETKSWSNGLPPAGAVNLAAIDLFANNATPVYYDDISLIPEPAAGLLLVLGLALIRRR